MDEESQLLTTFITPFGRFKYKKLPFGISAAPEVFQKRMSQILDGIEGVLINVDDILVHGRTIKEHDERLHQVLKRLIKAKVTLNKDKCVFGTTRVKFLGHIIDSEGIHIERIVAIKGMGAPQNISELRNFMGSINYLSKFIPQLAKKAKPLNDLLSPKNAFIWGLAQEQTFQKLKNALSSTPILAWFHSARETVISADASAYGFGAVLKQKQENGEYRPIAYASRTLTATQRNWAQIEKEGYALQWACEKFKNYITGLEVILETDHKPLISIFTTKHLDDLPPKLQRIRLRLARYQYKIKHILGKEIEMADILSRRPLNKARDDFVKEVIVYAKAITTNLPATDQRLQEIREAQSKDPICQQLEEYISQGWPKRNKLNMKLHDY